MRKLTILAACLCTLTAALPADAGAATRWTLRGAGWGHGIGMSQFGAYGFARHGTGYRDIIAHYYTGTRIERRPTSLVRVLLQANRSTITFTGATKIGDRNLKERSAYLATRSGPNIVLRSASGRKLETYAEVIPVTGGETVRLIGKAGNGVSSGYYRGELDIRIATGSGLNAINTVGLEDYVQGVVPAESPPIWPLQALAAQAVAARTYALAANVNGRGFEQYPDTRSQVYRGFSGETASTNNAVATTRGEVVTYKGDIVITYFFSTSGGFTENVENVFTNSPPRPWLKGVEDPYDDASPHHRWGPFTLTSSSLRAKLGGYVKGSFKGLKVVKRGVSPRIVRAKVRGSRGTVTVTGPELRKRLGLRDTWFYLRKVRTNTSSAKARTSSGTRKLTQISGEAENAKGRFVDLERRDEDGWAHVADVPLFGAGEARSYSFHVAKPGLYRVRAGWAPGPEIPVPVR